MSQRRVSFEVAKAIKEAGFPQGKTLYRYVVKHIDVMCFEKITHYVPGQLIKGTLSIFDIEHPHFSGISLDESIDASTYLDVWLWLWREKKIYFSPRLIQKDPTIGDYTWLISPWDIGYIKKTFLYSFHNSNEENPYKIMDDVEDPEAAIIAAIEHLATNDLIK